jgi:peptidylprolyl isomerase
MRDQSGEAHFVRVAGISEASITLDANHPLAGKDLTFDIRLVEVKS